MHISKKQERRFYIINVILLICFTVLWLIGNYIFSEVPEFGPSLFQSIMLILAAGFAGTLCVYITFIYKYSTSSGKIWLLIGLGMFGWMIGDIIYTYYDLFTEEAPFPSIADTFYLIAYVPLFLGFFLQYKALKFPLTKNEKMINFVIFIIICIFVILSVLVFPILSWYGGEPIPPGDAFEIFVAVLYPIFDLHLLILVMIVLTKLRHGEINKSWILLTLGILFNIVGDILFNWVTNAIGEEVLFEIFDLLYLVGYILIFMGAFTLITVVYKTFLSNES